MKTIALQQGSPEWHAHRGRSDIRNASEAPAMMGATPNLKRSDLIRSKATGSEKEFSRFTQEVIFARGKGVEALSRPFAETFIGEELFPVTGVSDEYPHLSASFDGITMDERVVWECKQWNEAKAVLVRAGTVPPEDHWQCVQQLVVSRAERLVYTLSDGTEENTIHCELRLSTLDQKRLLDSWKQFDADLAAYQPEPQAEAVVGRAPEQLPALLIQVTGTVMASNLPAYKARALEVFRSIKTELQTDNDFADAEQAVKFCKGIEERLDEAKKRALEQTVSIDELFRAIDEISAEARAKRLELDKLVKNRKESIRLEIIRAGDKAFSDHLAALSERIRSRGARVSMPVLSANFAGVMKGLKTVSSIKDAVATELARMKIEANALADKMDENLRVLTEAAAGYETLFPDTQQLALKDSADLTSIITARIANHLAEQLRRDEAARKVQPAPAVAPAAPAAATQATAAPATKPRLRADGPTTVQVVALVAKTYGVSEDTACRWLASMNFRLVAA